MSRYIQNNISFVIIEVSTKTRREELESRLISTVSLCDKCMPSDKWLGLHSTKPKIRDSGLWNVNELYKDPLTKSDLKFLQSFCD